MKKRSLVTALIMCSMIFSGVTDAGSVTKTGYIVQTINTSKPIFGGCMVKLDASFGSGCTEWVTFDCNGGLGTPTEVALRMMDSGNMAFALGQQVTIQVDTGKKHNAHCLGTRIDVLPPPP